MKTLGIDLGSNSLGWAVLDDLTGEVLHKGVVVFPDGIDPANDTLKTPAAIRRGARMGRRMKFRRKLRKWSLLKILIDHGMCPLTANELLVWQKDGKYPVSNRVFLDWLKATDTSNPYCDRNAAAEGKVEPLVLGRALYHICQRRGFKSSRKDAIADTGDDAADQKATANKLGKVATDITTLTESIKEAGCKTLGQYFYRLLQSQCGKLSKERVRGRYTGRLEHYQAEFAVLMDVQGIQEPLRGKLYKAIFMQRPLRSQKNLVGKCPLETSNARVAISHPSFEEFRMLEFVNNLSFDDVDGNRVPLTEADRQLVCRAFMKASPTIKFGDIRKLFKGDARFKGDKHYSFHYYRDDETLSSCSVRHRLAKAFGDIAYDEQKVFDALTFFDDDEKLRDWLRKHYPALDNAAVLRIAAIHPKEGNAAYSLKAINRILPFLRRGYELSQAKFLAKMPEVVPGFRENEDRILRNLDEIKFQYRQDKADLTSERAARGEKVIPLMDRYRAYLLEEWNVTDDLWKKLYLIGENHYDGKVKTPGCVPPVELGMIRNPLVQRSMTTLRRLVNYLRVHGQIDGETTIRIELARNVNNFAARQAWQIWQKQRAALREKAKEEIAKYGVAITEDAIDRYVLAQEQGWKCLYTKREIKMSELFSGKFDIEHTVPRSLSGDDSLANRTVCESEYNRTVKQGKVPRDCPQWCEIDVMLREWRQKLENLESTYRRQCDAARLASDPLAKSKARIKALTTRFELDYWRDKVRRFDVTADKLVDSSSGMNGFKRRQLVDTGVMSSHAVELLRSVYPKVFAVNGAATAFARKAWGLQSDSTKDRSDHLHHAKDAMVIAALTPARFMAICSVLKDDGRDFRRPCDVCPPPWPGFADRVRRAAGEILVKHVLRQTTLHQSSKRNALAHAHPEGGDPNGRIVKFVKSQGDTVRGQLHKETFYGKIKNPSDCKIVTVERVPLSGKISEVRKWAGDIVDPAIREIVVLALDKLTLSGRADFTAGEIRMPSGVPIKRVRVIAAKSFQNPWEIKRHAFESDKEYKRSLLAVSAGDSNFRMALIAEAGKLRYCTEAKFGWAVAHKQADYVSPERRAGFVGYVYPGSMAIACEGGIDAAHSLTIGELTRRLYYVRSLPTDKDSHAEVQFHTIAGAKKDITDKTSEIDDKHPHALIRTSAGKLLSKMLFEGIHFKMMLDGSIKFLK